MKAEFWLERWENNLIGFHLDEVNPLLTEYWPQLGIPAGNGLESRVLVPLCGKSLDLIWLAEQGYQVTGIEISPLGVEAFFRENQLQPSRTQTEVGEVWQAGNIRIICADYFEVTPEILGPVEAVFDRAAMISMPAEMRAKYMAHMLTLTGESTPHLLITLEYDETLMSGPPFMVSEQELRDFFGKSHKLQKLTSEDILTNNDKFRQRGLTYLNEIVWKITP